MDWQSELIKELSFEPSKKQMFDVGFGATPMDTFGGKLGRMGRKWVIDPARHLGDVMAGYGETGEIKASDALDIAAGGIGAGWGGGLPAGATGAGSITRTKLPFTSRLSKLFEQGKIGDRVIHPKTPMGDLGKAIQGDRVLREEMDHMRSHMSVYDAETLETMAKKYAVEKKYIAQEEILDKVKLTGDDVQYGDKDWPKFKEQGGWDYEETLLRNPKIDYDAGHFNSDLSEISGAGKFANSLSEGLAAHRRGHTTQVSDAEGRMFKDRNKLSHRDFDELISPAHQKVYDRYLDGEITFLEYDEMLYQITHQTKLKKRARPDDIVNHITELQTDLHQQASKSGGYRDTDKLRENVKKWKDDRDQIIQEMGGSIERFNSRLEKTELGERYDKIERRLAEAKRAPELTPYTKDTWKIHLQDQLAETVDKGHSGLTWTTGETQAKRNAKWIDGKIIPEGKHYTELYDKKMINYFKKEFGITPEKRLIPDKNSTGGMQRVWYVPINRAIKLKMRNRKNLPMAMSPIDRFKSYG